MNGERGCRLELFVRECFERNSSAQNGSKASCKREAYPYLRGTVPYRTVPKSRVNAALVSMQVLHILYKYINTLRVHNCGSDGSQQLKTWLQIGKLFCSF